MFLAKRAADLKFSKGFTYSEFNKYLFSKIYNNLNKFCPLNFIANMYLMQIFHHQPFADLAVLQTLRRQNKY